MWNLNSLLQHVFGDRQPKLKPTGLSYFRFCGMVGSLDIQTYVHKESFSKYVPINLYKVLVHTSIHLKSHGNTNEIFWVTNCCFNMLPFERYKLTFCWITHISRCTVVQKRAHLPLLASIILLHLVVKNCKKHQCTSIFTIFFPCLCWLYEYFQWRTGRSG